MKEAPHEKMQQDEVEYAERGSRAYAICCSQRELDDVIELQAAYYAGFKSACAYLRAPGIERAAIVDEVTRVIATTPNALRSEVGTHSKKTNL